MFAYNPSQPNNAGAMIMQGQQNADAMQMQGVQALGQGIGQAGQDIGSAMQKLNDYHIAQQRAAGTVGAAASMGILKPEDVTNFQNMPLFQQVGYAQDVAPLMQAQGMMAYHNALAQGSLMRGQAAITKADASSSKMTGTNPWYATPAPGGLGVTPTDSSSSSSQ